jgi:hypothetical protein
VSVANKKLEVEVKLASNQELGHRKQPKDIRRKHSLDIFISNIANMFHAQYITSVVDWNSGDNVIMLVD